MKFWPSILTCVPFALLIWASQSMAQDSPGKDEELAPPEPVRIYRSPEERRDAGLGKQMTEWLKVGAVVELEKEWQRNILRGKNDTNNPDLDLAIELGFEVDYHDWLEAEVLFAIEDNGRRHYQELDEGLVGVSLEDWGIKLGRLYVPFGAYYSHFVTGPLLEIGQTRGDAILMDYTLMDSVEVAAYILDSKIDRRENHNEVDWGVSLEYTSNDESIRVGAGYISDLSESQDEILLDFNNNFLRRVSAWNAYALIGLSPFEATAEILRAVHPFREFPKNANQPFAFNLELAYFPIPGIQVATRLEHSEEFMDAPEWQYGLSGTWAPWPNLTVSADYLYGRYKKGVVSSNRLLSHHLTVLQLTLSF